MPKLLLIAVALLIAGCSSQAVMTQHADPVPTPETTACLVKLANSATSLPDALDAEGFSMINWNVQKGRDAGWVEDLHEIDPEADLLLLQEVEHDNETWDNAAPRHYRSFAEGYANSRMITGVMTTSSAQPLTECSLVAYEPWFGTRKATLVTEYALTNTDKTLLVVNIHGINFTLGIDDMRDQLRQVQAIIEQHEGAVLLAGDFNTWNGRRAAVLNELVNNLDLVAINFSVDHRMKIFGRTLDHIYVRGLNSVHATTMDFQSSDHNPMSVYLRLTQESPNVEAPL